MGKGGSGISVFSFASSFKSIPRSASSSVLIGSAFQLVSLTTGSALLTSAFIGGVSSSSPVRQGSAGFL